jgi:hypothetical protein
VHQIKSRNVSLSAPIFAREYRRWMPVSSRSALRATNVRKKKARKRNADRRVANLRTLAGCGARRALRARLSASHHGSLPLGVFHPKAQPGPGFVTHRPNERVLRQPVWHFQRCTSHAGHSAGRLMPRPPECGGDEPPPAGTDSRSALRSDRMTSLYGSEIGGLVSNPERDVTELFPGATYAHLVGLSEPCELRYQQ